MSKRLLHISPHYGGGVGTVTRCWTSRDTQNEHFLTYLNNSPENEGKGPVLFNPEMVNYADIVICHIWNHPALFDFLMNCKLPPCRMIGWSHMSGLYPPYAIFEKLVNYFDEFYYTSPVSNASGILRDSVWSCGDMEPLLNLEKKAHTGFNIGYIGTLDFCKLHPDFMWICSQLADIPDIKFTIIGDGCDKKNMVREVGIRDISDRTTFTGLVSDIKPYLQEFDAFMYPLYENHFGTCEQVLGEAMSAGIPCFVLDNPAENYIIQDGFNGIICRDTQDMVKKVKDFFRKKIQLDEKNIRNSAKNIYSLEKKIETWNKIFENIMTKPKAQREWLSDTIPFVESLGPDASVPFRRYIIARNHGDDYDISNYYVPQIKELFRSNRQWSSKSKGSILQYLEYFPDDYYLKKWSELL